MKNQSTANISREAILKMLSDEEITNVTIHEEHSKLVEGDEFIDLQNIDKGVQQVHANTKVNTGNVIPRSAIREDTWSKVIKLVKSTDLKL